MINRVVALAYQEAMFADALYSKTICNLYGEDVSRWTMTGTQACNREVKGALRMKLEADQRYLHARDASKNRSAS